MPATYEPIASTTLGSDTASYTFSSIPQTFTDLVAVVHAVDSVGGQNICARANGDTGTNYSYTQVYGNGTSAASSRVANTNTGFNLGFTALYSGTDVGITVAHFMSYANTNVYKTALADGSLASAYVARRVALWRSTAAITSLTFLTFPGNMKSGTTLALFGLKAAA